MPHRSIFVLCATSVMLFVTGCDAVSPPSPPTVGYTLSTTYPLRTETALSVNCKNVGDGITVTPANCTPTKELRIFMQSWREVCEQDRYSEPFYRWVPDKTATATLQPSQVAAVVQQPDEWQHIDFRFDYDFLSETETGTRDLQEYLNRSEVTIYASAEVIASLGLQSAL